MTMTPFFLELHAAYQSELDDLATDSEGRDVLQQRLREKRHEIGFLAQMMELSPEMVAVVFHRGFQFREPAVMEQLLTLEADEFPDWDDVLVAVQLHHFQSVLINGIEHIDHFRIDKHTGFFQVKIGLLYIFWIEFTSYITGRFFIKDHPGKINIQSVELLQLLQFSDTAYF